jgi:antitoxin HicB
MVLQGYEFEIDAMEYIARLKPEDGIYLVSFPDFEHINTYGETREEALQNAHDALNGVLSVDFERGYGLSASSPKRGRNVYVIRVDPNIALAYQQRAYVLPEPTAATGRNAYPIRVLPNIAIAYQLRRLRENQSQADVARKIGISYQAYQKLENPRKCNPTVKTLEKISHALGKTLDVAFH